MGKKQKIKPAEQAKTGVSPISGTPPPAEHQFKPGQSGNPQGRPNAGASIKDWINQLAQVSPDEVRAVLEDRSAPSAKVIAARAVISAAVEEVRDAFSKVLDYTDGKPSQSMDVTSNGETVKGYALVTPDDWDSNKKDNQPVQPAAVADSGVAG